MKHFTKSHEVAVMVKIMEIYEHNNCGNSDGVYKAGLELLNMLGLSAEAKAEGRRLHTERCKKGDFDLLENTIKKLTAGMMDDDKPLEQPTATPTPEPQVEPAAAYKLPTAKMRVALARFDDLSDADQVDQLQAMGW